MDGFAERVSEVETITENYASSLQGLDFAVKLNFANERRRKFYTRVVGMPVTELGAALADIEKQQWPLTEEDGIAAVVRFFDVYLEEGQSLFKKVSSSNTEYLCLSGLE